MTSRRKIVAVMAILATCVALGFAVSQAAPAPSSPGPALPRAEPGFGLAEGEVLAGSRSGLFRLAPGASAALPLWTEGEVRKILRPAGGQGWLLLSSKGMIFSPDLSTFTPLNSGLPFKTYKRIEGGKKVFEQEVSDLKDLESDATGLLLVTCTKDEVFLSRNGGQAWTNLGSPSTTTGLKAVALAPFPGSAEPGVWASHPIKGLFARKLSGGAWVPVSKGLYIMPTMSSTDEVADLVWAPAPAAAAAAAGATAAATTAAKVPAKPQGTLWASNSFQQKIFKASGGADGFSPAWDDGRDFGTAESLSPRADGSLRFVADGGVFRLPAAGGPAALDPEATALAGLASAALPLSPLLALAWNEGGLAASLSELWLLAPDKSSGMRKEAAGRRSIYLQAGYIVDPAKRAKNFAILAERGLDSITVDLKDDNGRLRFAPLDPFLKSLGKTSSPIDIEAFVAEARARGVWLVARIPVFKDESLSKAAGGKYAVWDGRNGIAWRGYRTESTQPSTQPPIPGVAQPPAAPASSRVYYGEYWVDPYSEEVWAYNVAIANEIVARGFDEVQFDYIRFPTDGENLSDAVFRWKDPGMDRESAIASFLAFARSRISAPIGIDIYGANGWYRSGARTGQDVELLARYVDVICPMLYPSHFEQGFLAQVPAVERPLRIYRLGSLRNERIARNRVVVRPYVQAFYMGVSYDKAYYNPDYVAREVAGVASGANLGMTFWNNVDRYDDIPFLSVGADGGLVIRSSSAAGSALVLPTGGPASPGAPAAGQTNLD